MLDLFSENFRDAYTLSALPALGKAVHNLVFLSSSHKPTVWRQPVTKRTVRWWSSSIFLWHESSTVTDREALQRVVRTAAGIIGFTRPSTEDVAQKGPHRRATTILRDPTHPCQGLFSVLPSGKKFRSPHCSSARFQKSFYPTAIRLLNRQ